MTIQGPGGPPPVAYTRPARPAEAAPPAPPVPPAVTTRPGLDRPVGADPDLWNVLTTEEREYFAQLAELGPLTYGPGAAERQDVPAPVGRRLDVTV